ncbi:MAG: cell wall hydrolase [Sphingopyxis sp.]
MRNRKARQKRIAPVLATVLLVLFVVMAMVIGSAVAPEGQRPSSALAPPVVEPVAMMALSPQNARVANGAQPFVEGSFPAAAPYRFTGDATNAARAADCLAAALLYEAGDDAVGQRAVAQVIINRSRHPAFPKSLCGVVFQGSERRTGCQFTFTCDGALNRRYSDAAWSRARGIAIDALNGAVYRPVGLATHYHTDWVRPYWSPHLEKLAQVGTHLFFRWPGFWGSPGAFRGQGDGQEPIEIGLAHLSTAHGVHGATPQFTDAPMVATDAAVAAAIAAVVPRQNRMLGDTIILTLERGATADTFPSLAQAACGARDYCKVMGWTNPQLTPDSEEMSVMARASMSFSYLRDEARGLERALWNCDEFSRSQSAQCMRR